MPPKSKNPVRPTLASRYGLQSSSEEDADVLTGPQRERRTQLRLIRWRRVVLRLGYVLTLQTRQRVASRWSLELDASAQSTPSLPSRTQPVEERKTRNKRRDDLCFVGARLSQARSVVTITITNQ